MFFKHTSNAAMSLRCRLLLVATLSAAATLTAQAQTAEPGPAPAAASPVPVASPATAPTAMEPAPESPAQVSAPAASPVLTLEDAVLRALEKNFDLRIQTVARDNADEALIIARSAFDPSFDLTYRRSYARGPSGSTVVNGNVVTGASSSVDADSTRIGVSQLMPTGGVVSASGALDRTESTPLRTLPNPAYDSDVAISVRQPLLRNAGTRLTRASVERAKLGVEIAQLDFKSSVLSVVRDVEVAYNNLAFAREQLIVRRFSLEVAQKLLDENRSRAATGVATDLDVLQAEVGLANATRNVLLAEQAVKDREDGLLAQIQPFGFSTAIGDVRLDDMPAPRINGDLSFKLARDNTPEYLAQQAAISQLQIDSDVARRNRLPTLDVGGALGYNTRETSYGSAMRNVWDGEGYSWAVDATLSFPWGLRGDRARYRQTLNTLSREQIRLQAIEQDIMVQVRAAVRSVETNLESVRISGMATQLSQRQYELEKARYDAGLSTFRRVQEAQEDLDNSRVLEIQARVTLRNAIADLARLEGSSLQRYRVNLEN